MACFTDLEVQAGKTFKALVSGLDTGSETVRPKVVSFRKRSSVRFFSERNEEEEESGSSFVHLIKGFKMVTGHRFISGTVEARKKMDRDFFFRASA